MKNLNHYINEWKYSKDKNISDKRKITFVDNRQALREEIIKRLNDNIEDPYLLDIYTHNINDMSHLFTGINSGYLAHKNIDASKIKRLDLSTWDVSNVEDFWGMFHSCTNLQEIIGIDEWDVSSGLDFSSMFGNCPNLRNINIEKWGSKLKKYETDFRMDRMFSKCDKSIIPSWYDKNMWK